MKIMRLAKLFLLPSYVWLGQSWEAEVSVWGGWWWADKLEVGRDEGRNDIGTEIAEERWRNRGRIGIGKGKEGRGGYMEGYLMVCVQGGKL